MRQSPFHDQPLQAVEIYRTPVSMPFRDACRMSQGISQRPDKLHPSDLAQQLYSGSVDLFVLGLEPNGKIPTSELGVAALQQAISLAHKVHFFLAQLLFKLLHRFEEDNDLIRTPSGNIRGTRLKTCSGFGVQSFPFRG